MTVLFTIVHVFVCFILVAVILLQAGRGQGLTGASFGGGNVQSVLGTRAGDFLTKATSVAAICFLFTCIGLNYLEIMKSQSLLDSGKRSVPLDVEQIKKALEKIKAEEGKPASTEETVQTAASKVSETVGETTAAQPSQEIPVPAPDSPQAKS